MMPGSITYEEARTEEDRPEIAVAYLRAGIEAGTENKHNSDNNDIKRLEKVALLLNKASLTFKEAMNSNGSKRRELLEDAFKAYVDIVPYLGKTPYLTYTVLKQIKNIEKMLELEIENSIKNDNTNAIDIDSMKEARVAFLNN